MKSWIKWQKDHSYRYNDQFIRESKDVSKMHVYDPEFLNESKKKKYKESSDAPSEDKQRDDIDMFVREWLDDIVKPYIYDHDVEGLATELAHVTDRLVNWDSDTVIEELGYEPDWDLFEEVSSSVVEDTVGDLTYKEGLEDLNDLFCEEFE